MNSNPTAGRSWLSCIWCRSWERPPPVTAAIRDAHPEVPWTDVIGMRNHLVHGYDDADLNLLHSTIVTDLPALVAQLTAILDDEP